MTGPMFRPSPSNTAGAATLTVNLSTGIYADLLAGAKFPVIVAGGGVIFADGVRETTLLAEQLQAPVVSSYLHNDSFPSDHPLWAGPLGYQGSKAAMKLIAQADVVLALGTRLGPFGTSHTAPQRIGCFRSVAGRRYGFGSAAFSNGNPASATASRR